MIYGRIKNITKKVDQAGTLKSRRKYVEPQKRSENRIAMEKE